MLTFWAAEMVVAELSTNGMKQLIDPFMRENNMLTKRLLEKNPIYIKDIK